MKFSTPAVSKVVLAVAGLVSVVQAGGQHLAARGSDSSKHSQVARKLWKRFSGRGSFYDPNTGNQGACGGFIGTNDWVVALNTDQFAGGAHCNQQVTITANGKTQTATIKDACPGCGYGGLDLTPGLFSAFADHSVGIIQLTWNFGGSSGGGGGGGGNNDNNNNDNHDQWTSTSTSSRYTPQWTPSSSSTPRWTPSSSSRRRTSTSSQWTPPALPSSTWSPSSSSQWSQSTSSWSSSSSRSSSSSSSSSISSSEIANSTMAINSTMTNTTATLTDSTAPAATGSNTALLSPVASNNTNTGSSGALANMAQVVVRMANVVVAAADTA